MLGAESRAGVCQVRSRLVYLDGEASRWYTLSLGKQERPRDWRCRKQCVSAVRRTRRWEGHEGLRKVEQTGTVRGYLARVDSAVADCVYLSQEVKLKYCGEGLHPRIRRFVHVCRPGHMSEVVRLATYLRADVETDKERRRVHVGAKKDQATRPTYRQPASLNQGERRRWLLAPEPALRYGVM